jgi:hypothetical protein
VKRTIGEAKQDRIMLTAAGVAFYWVPLGSLTPIAAIGILALLHVGRSFVNTASKPLQLPFRKAPPRS